MSTQNSIDQDQLNMELFEQSREEPACHPKLWVNQTGSPPLLRSYGGHPSHGLPSVAHALDGKRERRMAEREGFEPPCGLPRKTLSRRPRYDHFGTSPVVCAGGSEDPPLRQHSIIRAAHSVLPRRIPHNAHRESAGRATDP